MITTAIGFLAAFFLIFLQIPIALALGLVGAIGFAVLTGFQPMLGMLATVTEANTLTYSLTVIPLFVLMGNVLAGAGISSDLYNVANRLVGRKRGALGVATVVSCGGFAAISGSSTATAATMGRVAIPAMREQGYADSLAAATVAAGGTLGILIPPSVILVIYGVATQTHIGELFAAGLIPGLVGILGYSLAVIWTVYRDPSKAPLADMTKFAAESLGKQLWRLWPVIGLFGLVMGGIYSGFFTATEAAGVGAIGGIFFALLKRALPLQVFWKVILETVEITCSLFAIILGAAIFGEFINLTGIHRALRALLSDGAVSPTFVILTMVLIYVLLGCVLEGLSIILLTIPIFFPVVVALGYDPVWFGILVVLVVEIGLITPPIGVNLFIIRAVYPDISMSTIIRGVLPFIGADILRVLAVIAFPALALFLPEVLFR